MPCSIHERRFRFPYPLARFGYVTANILCIVGWIAANVVPKHNTRDARSWCTAPAFVIHMPLI